MTTLVTGATGFIGYEVVRQLSDARKPVRALIRRTGRAALLNPFRVQPAVGDLASPASLRRACRGVDTVVHLAARATMEPLGVLRGAIVDGSLALLHAAAEEGVTRFVFASTLLVHAGQPRGEINATTPLAPVVDYGRAKAETERRLHAAATEHGVNLAILRFPHIYGARDVMFSRFRRRLSLLPALRADAYAHCHVVDCARLLIAVAEQGWTGTSPFGDDTNAGWDEFFAVLRRWYPGHPVLRVPAALAAAGTAALEPLTCRRGRPSLLTRDTVRAATLRQPVQPGLVWRDVGLTPLYPSVDEGIPAALDELVAYRWRPSVDDRRR